MISAQSSLFCIIAMLQNEVRNVGSNILGIVADFLIDKMPKWGVMCGELREPMEARLGKKTGF